MFRLPELLKIKERLALDDMRNCLMSKKISKISFLPQFSAAIFVNTRDLQIFVYSQVNRSGLYYT